MLFIFVLDEIETTCEKCKQLEGSMWEFGDPDIPKLPIHDNCRCKLIPVKDDDDDD